MTIIKLLYAGQDMIGSTLSHYKITAELGRGGMGVVYRATDTSLDRVVALKVLPASALSSEDDRARFYREAKAAAALNHPNIAQVYQIAEAVPGGGASDELRPFIAMEFIDGETLEDRVKAGPFKLEEAVRVVTQIASALEVAHEKQIVHRDIKAQNVMTTAKGVVKVLDFGLAQTAASTKLTRMGSTLGTIAYMSPEQARGDQVDGRTDLWALGVVLYELITGRLPFGGDYEQAVTYSILNEDPEPMTAIRTGVPMGLEWIVSKLLAKKVDDRYQTAKDLIVDLRTVDMTSTGLSRLASGKSMPVAAVAKAGLKGLSAKLSPVVLVGAVIFAIALGFWAGTLREGETGQKHTMKRIVQSFPLGGLIGTLDISPQGDKIAFATETINVLDLSLGKMRRYDAPGVYIHTSFSPDGQDLLLTTSTGIEVLSLTTGSVLGIIETNEGGPRAEWIDKETILYEDRASVYIMSLTTSETRRVVTLDSLVGQYDLDYPFLLPDGKTLMATVQYRDDPDQIGFWDLKSGANRGYLNVPGLRSQWIESGHLIFVMNGDVMAMPFDADKLQQTGPIIPLDKNVRPEGLSVSKEGTLVHVGPQVGIIGNSRPNLPVVVFMENATMAFETDPGLFPAAVYRSAVIDPSGTKAAIVIEGDIGDSAEAPTDIWILDFETGSRRALTSGGVSDYPAWSVTGDSLYFVLKGEYDSIMVMAATGRGGETLVMNSTNPSLIDLTISHDGKWAAMGLSLPPIIDASSSILLFDLKSERSSVELLDTVTLKGPNGNPRHFDFSPDGKYLAYEDQEGIFVQSLEDKNSTPVEVWENGKTLPKWTPDGSRIFVRDVSGSGNSIEVQLDPVFSTQSESVDLSDWYAFKGAVFDIFPEENKFLLAFPDAEAIAEAQADSATVEVNLYLIVNLFSELGKEK